MIEDLTDAQIAYIAGLVDGEGSIECQKEMQRHGATPRYTLRLSFCFATAEPLATVSTWLGMTPTRYPSRDDRRQDRWRLHIPKAMSVVLLRRALPHLILKREQARLMLDIEAVRATNSPLGVKRAFGPMPRMSEAALAQMDALHLRLRALKSNKRPMSLRAA